MLTVKQTIRELKIQRNRTQQDLAKLGLAIKALEQLDGNITAAGTPKPKRTMSASARARIAAAQRARWAKVRAQKKK